MEEKYNYKVLIDTKEFQQNVLDYIKSDKFDKMYDSTVFRNNPDYRPAMVHGMVIASMLTSQCEPICVKEKVSKIKVSSAEIVVHGTADKPYYEIKYYTLDGEEHIGYGSYDLKNVFGWIKECFEICK